MNKSRKPFCPFKRLRTCKSVMHKAADTIKEQMACPDLAANIHARVYWTLVAFRKCNTIGSISVERALCAYPGLRQFFGQNACISVAGLHNHLMECLLEKAEIELGLLDQKAETMGDEATVASQKRRICAWMQIWRGRDKKIRRLVIKEPGGDLADSSEAGAWILAHHWLPIFQATQVNIAVARKYLHKHLIRVEAHDDCWIVPFNDFDERCGKRRDSGPGPDDVPYSSWRAAPPCFREAIYGAYLKMLAGAWPDEEFNNSLLPFIEKGTQIGDTADTVVREPGQTRPLSMSNTDNKMIADLVARPLRFHVTSKLHGAQRGGLAGEQMVDNLLDIEMKAIEFALKRQALAGVVAFDMKTAFPALAREYIF